MSINFITFGSHDNFIDAGNRLMGQAKGLNIFNEMTLYTGDYLKKDVPFWTAHGEFISKNRRGYGHWLWKPYLIKQNMEKMNDGDILLYLDSGCEIDVREKDYLLHCIELVKKDKLIGTVYCDPEKYWNKMDLIVKLDMTNTEHLNTLQRQGGVVLFLVCNETRQLINKCYELGCDYHNIDDTPSIHRNLDCFREHRHDQSVFSLLTKKYNLYSDTYLSVKCIKEYRNKSGSSRIVM